VFAALQSFKIKAQPRVKVEVVSEENKVDKKEVKK
jgi:hypothetical protein